MKFTGRLVVLCAAFLFQGMALEAQAIISSSCRDDPASNGEIFNSIYETEIL